MQLPSPLIQQQAFQTFFPTSRVPPSLSYKQPIAQYLLNWRIPELSSISCNKGVRNSTNKQIKK